MLKRTLGTISLLAVVFFNVSGGPYSTEKLVGSLGPGLAILLLAVIPLVWALPETLIVSELSSMLPEEGGYYRWVRRAFGPFWAFQNGWATWLYSLVDMAIYPVLFNTYLAWFFPGVSGGAKWAVSLAVIWGATAINLRGARPVGRVSVWVGAFVVIGFVAVALAAIPHATHAPWVPLVKPGESVRSLLAVGLSTALWNYIGWDNASTVSEEVKDASSAYPKAILAALPIVTGVYFIAMIPTLAATDWTTWTEGSWPAIARDSGGAFGPVLATWIALAGMASAIALFNALLLSYSRIPLALANDGLLPAPLARTDARGTPRNAVLAAAVCYSVFTLLPFDELVVADTVLYAVALLMELSALVALRRREPLLRGAFRIPLGAGGVAALAALPAATFVVVVVLSFADGESALPALAGSFVGLLIGIPLYRWRAKVLVRTATAGAARAAGDAGT